MTSFVVREWKRSGDMGAKADEPAGFQVIAIAGLPLFAPGMDLGEEIASALARQGLDLRDGDVIVVAQKIMSKAEARQVALASVSPGPEARALAQVSGRPPEMAQLILDEASAILRATPAAVIARHRTGHVLANAGIDASNVAGGDHGEVLLWPRDPDTSARALRARLAELTGARPGVIVADSMGRAWRIGTTGHAIGVAGVMVLDDRRGRDADLYGRTLQATVIAVADALAATAVMAMGEGAEGTPVALVRGAARWVTADDGPGAAAGLRPLAEDMFR
jgi:coenzyme F420-0:L-glutamate ligase/coenzyme F420-1:gamma-L-glutamate ligase